MPKYTVYFEVYAQTHVEVEAADEAEAREKAAQEVETPSLCHHCCGPFEINDVGEITEVELLDD